MSTGTLVCVEGLNDGSCVLTVQINGNEHKIPLGAAHRAQLGIHCLRVTKQAVLRVKDIKAATRLDAERSLRVRFIDVDGIAILISASPNMWANLGVHAARLDASTSKGGRA